MSTKDLAGQLTDHDWSLFNSIHQVLGWSGGEESGRWGCPAPRAASCAGRPALRADLAVLPPAQVELIHYVLGPQHLRDVTTANLERFMRRFNELQYWVATELCLCSVPGLRAQLLRKFIKLAAQ